MGCHLVIAVVIIHADIDPWVHHEMYDTCMREWINKHINKKRNKQIKYIYIYTYLSICKRLHSCGTSTMFRSCRNGKTMDFHSYVKVVCWKATGGIWKWCTGPVNYWYMQTANHTGFWTCGWSCWQGGLQYINCFRQFWYTWSLWNSNNFKKWRVCSGNGTKNIT